MTERMDAATFKKQFGKQRDREPKVGKYRNKRVESEEGEMFDSVGELRRWRHLQALEASGKITHLRRQVFYELQPAFTDRDGVKHRPIRMKMDFTYHENGHRVAEDFKGFETAEFKLKEKMFRFHHPNIDFRLSRKEGR